VSALRDQINGQPPPLTVAYAARVARTPTGPDELLEVSLLHAGDLALLSSERAPYPDKGVLPARDDECLVVIDDAGRPWVVAWNEPGW
jgi:hypothetical protein